MVLTRRQFISRTGVATAGTLLGPNLWRNRFVRRAMADMPPKFFVVMFLDGGNDGLNTVVPVDDGTGGHTVRQHYQSARKIGGGGLQLSVGALTPYMIANCPGTGTHLALHPGFEKLWTLYNQGHVAVIQGCGYPEYNLSHEQSRRSWESGIPNGFGSGWMGRFLQTAGFMGDDIPAVNIEGSVAGEFLQNATSVIAVNDLEDFLFPYDGNYEDDNAAKRACFQSLYVEAQGSLQPTILGLGNAGKATLTATDVYPGLSDLYQTDRGSFDLEYEALDTGPARDFREIAKVIYGVHHGEAGINARFFQLGNGGYDTHSDQGTDGVNDTHYNLHKEVGDAIEVFYRDCADMGVANDVCVLVWSEFSRRIEQNDNGTDHGSQGPMFVVGGAVNGNVYGNHPDIDPDHTFAPFNLNDDGNTVYSQQAGNPFRSTDFRDVYGTILKQWLGIPQATILSSILTLDPVMSDDYWNTPNFNMGFLPTIIP